MTNKVTKYGLMIIAAVLLVALAFAGAGAATEISWDCGKVNPSDVTATLDTDTGVLTVSGVGDMANMNTGTQPWKDYRSQIKKVIISEGVTCVGVSAFQQCSELLEVQIPSTVTYIWDWAFGECKKLTTLDFMSVANPMKLCYGSIRADPNLRSIKVNFADRDGGNSFGSYAFYQDYLLESTYMTGGKIWIHGNPIWAYCNNLVQVVIDVESIDGWSPATDNQFGDAGANSVIYVPNGYVLPAAVYSKASTAVANIVDKANGQYKFVGTDAYVELNNKNSPFENVPLGKAVVWRDGSGTVVTVAPAVDTVLTVSLEDLPGGTCGDGVTWCFNEQTGELNIWGTGQITSTPWIASYASAIKTVDISEGITGICDNAFKDCTSLKRVSLGKDIATIGSSAFNNIGANSIIYAYSDTAATQLVASTNYDEDKTAVAKVIDELSGTYEFRGTSSTLYLNRENTPFSVNERVGMTWKDGGSEVLQVPDTTKTLTLVFSSGAWGNIGTGLRWVYDKYTKTITFDGNGVVSSFSSYKDVATSIVIRNGNVTLSNDAFAQMSKVTSVSIENAKVTVLNQKKNLGEWNADSDSSVIFTGTFDLTSQGSSLDLSTVFLGDGVFEISNGAALMFADGWKLSSDEIKNAMDVVFDKIGSESTILVGSTLYVVNEAKTGAGDSWILTDTTLAHYTVTIKAVNGTINNSKIEDVIENSLVTVNGQILTVKSNDVLASPTAKTGYATVLSRWSVGGSEYTGGTVTGDMEITAEFVRVANKYTVSFDGNGAIAGTQSDVIATYDAAMPELSSIGFTKQGYNFTGYFDKSSSGTKYYNADGTSAKIWDKVSDTLLYAQWMTYSSENSSLAVIGSAKVATFNDDTNAVKIVAIQNASSAVTAVNVTYEPNTVPPTSDSYYTRTALTPVFNITLTGDLGSDNATIGFNLTTSQLNGASPDSIYLAHQKEGVWEYLKPTYVQTGDVYTFTVIGVTSFSPFVPISMTAIPQYTPSSSSKQTGSTIILSEGQVAPTAYATAAPTVAPTVKPTEQPATPTVVQTAKPTTQATQQSPAPFVGLLAGLGAAAVLLRLRK